MIRLPSVIVSSIRTLADKTLRLTIDLPELSVSEMTDILTAFKMSESGIEIADIKTDDTKSPSKRLRNTLYRVWEQTAKSQTFEVYYASTMEAIINKFKEKLL